MNNSKTRTTPLPAPYIAFLSLSCQTSLDIVPGTDGRADCGGLLKTSVHGGSKPSLKCINKKVEKIVLCEGECWVCLEKLLAWPLGRRVRHTPACHKGQPGGETGEDHSFLPRGGTPLPPSKGNFHFCLLCSHTYGHKVCGFSPTPSNSLTFQTPTACTLSCSVVSNSLQPCGL